ncbi:c-type cytochrome [Sphingomonas nostoxanthinifaciens]|uniref:c-type cytochrome n=1 Tax=Sphingomonas nostoxanthinifaciens TaxID=2872652 RepID=UPI001CC1D69A|nr:cytochrome c [Sphingomonas nostoxanthinifaciens]UAK23275.1 cytochrome c [Sphingomonas nostoxanthinifaciens]
MTNRSCRLALIGAAALALPAIALAAGATGTVWAGAYTDAQATRGQAAYATSCAACHGDALNGGDSAPPLAGGAFLANWNNQSAGDLFTRIKTTMPFDAPGSLGSATVADIEAFILSRNGYPAGAAELTHDAGVLGQTRILAEKPAS